MVNRSSGSGSAVRAREFARSVVFGVHCESGLRIQFLIAQGLGSGVERVTRSDLGIVEIVGFEGDACGTAGADADGTGKILVEGGILT